MTSQRIAVIQSERHLPAQGTGPRVKTPPRRGHTLDPDTRLDYKKLKPSVASLRPARSDARHGPERMRVLAGIRTYEQARALVASLRDDLSKVVVTGAYRKAAAALDKHGFVLLIGEPAAGKTTIASLLAMAAIDQWNTSTLKLDDPKGVVKHWNPDEPSQFFWVDDAFGVTQYESDLVRGWNHILAQVRTMLRRGAKIVMTSRDYIYKRARSDLKESAFPMIRESQVVIDVHDLGLDEKRQILYNHVKLGGQPRTFRTKIKPFLEGVSKHTRFIPETARRLGDPLFTIGLSITKFGLDEFVEKQEKFLIEVLQGLDRDSRAALALIYMRNDKLSIPVEPQQSEKRALERLGSSLGGCLTALQSLDGSLVQYRNMGTESVWRFKHPTIADALGALLVQNPDLLEIHLQGSPIERLIEQVTCGDVGLENAVVIPRSLFQPMLDRLEAFSSSTEHKSPWLSAWRAKDRLQMFLARRCCKEFLQLYITRHPDLPIKVSKPGLFLSAVSEVDLATRLHDLGLLPEAERRTFVDTVSHYAVQGEDLYGLGDSDIRRMFSGTEFQDLRQRVRDDLVPRLDDVRRDWETNHSNDSAESHMQPFLDSLETLKNEFLDEPEAVRIIERETDRANEWISDNLSHETQFSPQHALGDSEGSGGLNESRSIFDDVDV